MKASERFHKENTMKQRLDTNMNDMEALEYFQRKESQKLIDIQYQQMMEEYPESLGRVLMLYIEVKINDHSIQAFCDTGAQATIMSKKVARSCQIDHLIDTRFAGTAVGVGTGTILGRIHMVQLQINDSYFPCSATVMDDPPANSLAKEMPFLLGLDMMKRHLCHIDLQSGSLKFRLSSTQYMEAKFLHEKDLKEEQGGTMGYDPTKEEQNSQQQQQSPPDNDTTMN
jgi:DNA damage-inducible protein 1